MQASLCRNVRGMQKLIEKFEKGGEGCGRGWKIRLQTTHRSFPTPGREAAQLLIIRHAIAFECDHHRWHGDGPTPLSPAQIGRSWKAPAGLKNFIQAPDR